MTVCNVIEQFGETVSAKVLATFCQSQFMSRQLSLFFSVHHQWRAERNHVMGTK